MFANILSKFIVDEIHVMETTLLVMYNDHNDFKIICDPGGEFSIDPMLVYGVELGDAVIITYKNNVALSIKNAQKYTFCGFIEFITNTNDDLQEGYYFELHPKLNVRGQINIPPNSRLIMPKTKNKVILPNKPIMLEYIKGPCKNYYEVI